MLAHFTRNYRLGLGFALMLFGMYAFYARRKSPDFFTPSSDTAQLKQKQELRSQILIIALSAALVVFVLLFVVQTRYILPFQPAGFALIAGVLAGVLAYYLKTHFIKLISGEFSNFNEFPTAGRESSRQSCQLLNKFDKKMLGGVRRYKNHAHRKSTQANPPLTAPIEK